MTDDYPFRNEGDYDEPRTERKPSRMPESNEAEKGVVCSILVDSRAFSICRDKGVSKDWFVSSALWLIFSGAMELWDRNLPCDMITLTEFLRERGQLDQAGGALGVTDAFDYIPTAANIRNYLDILDERRMRRAIIQQTAELSRKAYDQSEDALDVLTEAEKTITAIRARRETRQRICGIDIARLGMEELQRRIEMAGRISGLSTGFPSLDVLTDGLHGSELIVLAARPSLGKTALAMQIVEHLAIDCGVPCLVFSLEMGKSQLSRRLITSRAMINTKPWQKGYPPSDWQTQRLNEVANEFSRAPIYIEEGSDMTIDEIRSSARQMVRASSVRLIVIDTLSALRSKSKQARENRHREVAECINGCKEMAKELNIPVLVLAHIGRQEDETKPPTLRGLRESGNIEQDADSVWMLWQPPSDEITDEPLVELWCRKQRDGERDVHVKLFFKPKYTRFRENVDETAEQVEFENL